MDKSTQVSSSLVLRDISESLKTLIRAYVTELENEAAIVFQSPGQIGPCSSTCLSLYLYQIEYNPFLRNTPPQIVKNTAGGFQQVPAPAVVDLHYIMVPYAQEPEIELVIIDKLAQLFHGIATLEGDLLTPALVDSGNTNISIVPDNQNLHEIHNFWSSFPGKPYKLSLFYLLSPVRIPSLKTQAVDVDRIYQGKINYRLLDARS